MEGCLLTYIGKRQKQEDFAIASPNYTISIVCDGVGGRPDGEIASSFIGRAVFQSIIDCHKKDRAIELSNIIIKADQDLKKHLLDHNYSPQASTTIAVLVLFDDYAISAHVGDSRIYQFSSDGTFTKTKDHSRVQDLVDVGVISNEEDARSHKLSHIVTKIISGDLPLKKGDIRITKFSFDDKHSRLLLCTDGVIEACNDEELSVICSPRDGTQLNECLESIMAKIESKSKDNSTFILIDRKTQNTSLLNKFWSLFK